MAAERERFHRQMLSAVSHDLKTPLAAVIGSLEIYERMKQMLPPEKAAQLISTALQESYRLDDFVSNILDMAKLENGMVKTRTEPAQLAVLLREAIEKAGHRFRGADLQLDGINEDVVIDTDPALFSRIISLLLDNAIKHGGAVAAIRIEAQPIPAGVAIHIKDNGPGIPPGKAEEIFSKYTRLSKGDQQNAGTGLGLAIARGIATLLGGRLSAIPDLPRGADFILEMPTPQQ